jgi:alpha-tubulin suppressor-like RCC1 family protein
MLRNSKIRWGLKALLVVSLFLVVGCGSISGTVSSCGAPLPGVTVVLEGSACATTKTTTDASGNYRFPFLAKGTYTVTPSMSGYSFTPMYQTVTMTKEKNITGVNFDAGSGSGAYSVSGSVTAASGNAPLPGVTVELALTGAAPVTTTTDAGGNYLFACLAGGDYTITPLLPGYGFTPANRQGSLNASITANFTAAPNTARAWGLNDVGQLGDGTSAPFRSSPVEVKDLSLVVAVAAGKDHSLAILSDGSARAWGLGSSGQLGDGQSGAGVESNVPVLVSAPAGWTGKKVISIAAGEEHSLALLDDGTVWGWGRGDLGQLGNGSSADSPVPVQAQALSGVTAIDCGQNFSVAVASVGTVWTWGDNLEGQLGRDTEGWPSPTPGQVAGISGVTSIAAGAYHTIAAKLTTSEQVVWAWGSNVNGQLGVGSSVTQSSIPLAVAGLPNVVSVAAGGYHSVVAGSDGSVWTWGRNIEGQIGNGSTSTTPVYTPAALAGLTGIIKVDAGDFHTLVVKSP